MSFRFLFWTAVVCLVVSAGAGWIFFGDHPPDPEEVERQIQLNIVETARKQAETGGIEQWTAYARALVAAPAGLKDHELAMTWYRKAADKGYPPAQVGVGDLYARGLGVRQNHYKAAEWYQLATQLSNSPDAHFKLGDAYFRGLGVPQDYGSAVVYFKTAATGGHPVAQYILGSMYEAGWGVERDLIVAWVWYKRALPEAARILRHAEEYDVVRALARTERSMNRSQLDAAQRRFKKTAD